MSRNVGFDTFKDFTPISLAVGAPLYLVANSELGVDTTAALVEYAKRHPGQLNYGSVGRGSVFHFQGEAMKGRGWHRHAVPYGRPARTNANIIGDLLANCVQVYFRPIWQRRGAAERQDQVARHVLRSAHKTQRSDLPTVTQTPRGLTTVLPRFGFG